MLKTGWIIKSDTDQSYTVDADHCTYRIQEATVFTSEQAEQDENGQAIKVVLDAAGRPLRRV